MTKEEAKDLLLEIKNGALWKLNIQIAFDMAIKALEQEPILDKIRAEIYEYEEELFHRTENYTDYAVARHCLDIIDKYRAESEE